MDISNMERVRKLVSNLVSNPDLILPNVSKSILNNMLPIDHELPWWSYKAIKYADKIFPGKSVFEFGTGGSTVRYADVCKSITSIEDNEEWLRIVQHRVDAKKLNNINLMYRHFDFDHPEEFAESEYLRSYDGSNRYDVVIIDGQDKSFKERITCFRYVEPSIKDGSVIVLDDWWRYTRLLDSNRAKSKKFSNL